MKLWNSGVVLLVLLLAVTPAAWSEDSPSLYDLNSRWYDTGGKPVKVSVAKGSYAIVAMVYTGCAHACPMTLSKVKEVAAAIKKAGVKDLKFVIASFDVKNDRPERLKAYQASRGLNEDWKFISAATDSDARELAVALGISYKDLGNGDFSHSNVITLLDPSGAAIARIDSLTASTDVFTEALRKVKK